MVKSRLLVAIPAFNEAEALPLVVQSLRKNPLVKSILVIDDGSHDETYRIAKDLNLHVIRHPYNMGVGAAMRTAFIYAERNNYDFVIQVDADGQHPIGHISNLITAANENGADMVIGSRFIQASSSMSVNGLRRSTMRVLAWSASRAAKTKITDSTSGFRLIRQPLLGRFSYTFAANYLGDTYEAIIAAGRAGFKVEEISTPIRERLHGESSSSTIQSFLQTIKVCTVALLQLHTRI